MGNLIDMLLGTKPEVTDSNDVETLNLSVPPEGEPIYEAVSDIGTNDNPLVMTLPGGIKALEAPASSVSLLAYQLPNAGQIMQIGNYNPFRRRYCFRPWTNNIWICASYEDAVSVAAAPLSGTHPGMAQGFLPTNDTSIYSTAPLWIVCVLAGANNNFHVMQEFYDGGYPG